MVNQRRNGASPLIAPRSLSHLDLEWSRQESGLRAPDTILRLTAQNFLDVSFGWHHAIEDGTAGKIFHENLFEVLNRTERAEALPELAGHLLSIPRTSTFTLSQEQLVDLPIFPAFLLVSGWENLRPPVLQGPASPTAALWAPKQRSPYLTRIGIIQIPHQPLQGVLEARRKHRTTVTSLLHALTLVSMADQLSLEKAKAFAGETPFDLRRFIDPARLDGADPNGVFACLISTMSHSFDTGLVSAIRKQLQDQTDGTLSDGLSTIVWSVATRVKQEIPTSWAAGREDGWTIESCAFGQCAIVHGPAITIDAISTADKGLTITVAWQKNAVDDKVGERLSMDLKMWLHDLGLEIA
ncbi:uncharacterized protein BCR38DRAFT_413248 [Pseudomassariella vexata]|uniref:Alcohol acetyltransferase n=1 Tax=Pseudomassariella vexata TaxID=1141098 RepID=A0A1Y2DHV7_9PEZI|nr:uncharacterized protein BCR38DRAFT_413248 [Pseudomassariella vexata]ORY58375.1 hypothetical protein BCR38DRAFT_413248 [Pseudomassariella vexata]